MAMTLKLKLPTTEPHHHLLRSASTRGNMIFLYSSWYNTPPHPSKHHEILCTISEAINTVHSSQICNQSSLDYSRDPSIRRILRSLTPLLVTKLINLNPLSLPPSSIFSFFNWLATRPPFRHTLQSFCAMAHFLCDHRMLPQAHSLLCFLVSRKGHRSASSLFSSFLQTMPTRQSVLVFDVLISAYTDSGFVDDAVQCLRLVRKHNLQIPLRACENLLRHVMKLKPPGPSWEFYLEILECGYPPKVYLFNILMHGFCKVGDVRSARLVFDEIPKRGVRPTAVSFNTLISGYCKSGNVEEGFRLKRVMKNENREMKREIGEEREGDEENGPGSN